MSQLAEGTYPCTVVSATFGDNDKGIPTVQINVKLDTGTMLTYEDRVDMKSAPFVGKSCKAVGWNGETLKSLESDCVKWIEKTGGKSTTDIKHIPYNDKKTGEPKVWVKCNAIGSGNRTLSAPKKSSVDDADEAMRKALGDGLPF